MDIDAASLTKITASFKPRAYKRIFELKHKDTPLGTAPASARFSSMKGDFCTLYASVSLKTAIAEAIIRDRFEGGRPRLLFGSELEDRCVAQINSIMPLSLVDLRTDGCFQLGVSTDIASAKGWKESRVLAQHVHDHTTLDGFLYRSRLTGDNCIAVFDRAILSKLTAGKARALLASPGLPTALDNLNVTVIR